MQLFRNAAFLVLISMAVTPAPASAAYVVTLTNGETISAEDYKINDRTIELKMEGGSASFRRSLVASISGGAPGGKLLAPSSGARAIVQPPARTPGTRAQISGEDTLRKLAIDKVDSEAEAEEVVKPSDDITVEEFMDKEAENGDDESVDAADQEGNSGDDEGFMKEEEPDQGGKVPEE